MEKIILPTNGYVAMKVPKPDDLEAWGHLAGWFMVEGINDFHIAGPIEHGGEGVDGVWVKQANGTVTKACIGDWIVRADGGWKILVEF